MTIISISGRLGGANLSAKRSGSSKIFDYFPLIVSLDWIDSNLPQEPMDDYML